MRDGKSMTGSIKLDKGWKHADLSWRRSLQSIEPGSGLHGKDLTAQEKQALGLTPKALAFRQGNFLTPQARQAGILQNDIILGIDGKKLEFTAHQFDAHVRLNYEKEETVTIELLRQGQRLEVKMKLKGS
jgi:S1-C subfamily serine protease